MTDLSTDQSWLLTLTEAAERTGLTVEAIRQRIKRRKIRAIKGNDGRLRVRLTAADIAALTSQPVGHSTGQPTGQPVDDSSTIRALEDHITTLRDRLARAETMLDQARAETAAAKVEAGEGRAQAAETDQIMRRLMDAVLSLQARLESAEAEAKAAVETLQKVQARGFWARMLGR